MKEVVIKLKRRVKKAFRKVKYLDRTKARFFMVTMIISFFCLFVGGTYSYFLISDRLNSSIITIARLKYELTSENTNFKNNSITVKAGESIELTLDLRSLNEEETRYALNALANNPNVKIYYIERVKQNVEGTIGGLNSIINISIAIENEGTTDEVVNFELKGGYLQNTLSSNITEEYTPYNGLVPQIVAHITDGRALPSDSSLKSGTPTFSNTAPVISSYKSNTSSNLSTRNLTKDEKSLYVTYADSYSFNTSTGLYTLSNPRTCIYSVCYENLKGKYLSDYRGMASSQVISSTDIGVIYKVDESTTSEKLVYQTLYQGSDSYSTSNDGIYTMADDYGTSYYFRGDITNNYVKFGTWKEGDRKGSPMYWRIIRINGDGSVRMIYDGTSPYDNNVPSQDRVALTDVAWNKTYYNDNKYVGYMYGGANGTASTSKANATAYETDSNVKTELDNWYKTNLSDVDEYIADSIFCNDRSIGTRGGKGFGIPSSGTDFTFYKAYDRLKTGKNPSLTCPEKSDAFTVKDTFKGNGALTYKVGLPRADEVALAGGVNGKSNGSYYMYKGYWYRTSTPYAVTQAGGAGMMFVDTAGNPLSNRVDELGDVAPVINLSAEYAKKLRGDGTKENPYKRDLTVTKVSFTINFDANGGTVNPSSKEVETETVYGELPTPTKEDAFFAGWYTKPEGGYLITSSTSVLLSSKTLYAHWIPAITITFDANGGTVNLSEKKVIYTNIYGELPIPERENYLFEGWFTERDNGSMITSQSVVTSDVNQTLYAHWKTITLTGQATKVLLSKSNFVDADYISTTKGEMYTFTHSEATQTTGWSEEERMDYRYIGDSPNNYINFNDEIWRIIGVFTVENEAGVKEQRIKIIREASIGDFPWDMKSDRTHVNEWPTSTLATMLNGNYLNSGGSFTYTWYLYDYNDNFSAQTSTVQGLNSIAKNQIAPAKWYLGGSSEYKNLRGPDYYNFERGTTVHTGHSTNSVANVGLMYPSDYIYTYSNGVDNTCYTNGYNCDAGTPTNGWLYNSLSTNSEWLISPNTSASGRVFARYLNGFLDNGSYFDATNDIRASRPCVYLRSDIQIVGGNGSSSNPYTLGS